MQQVIIGGFANIRWIPANSTNYNCISGHMPWQAAELDACQVVSTPGTIDRLYIETSAAPGAGEQWQFWIRVNGVSSAITVTIAGAAQTAGSDLANSVAVNAGDYIDIMCTASAGSAVAVARYSVRFTGSVAGESLMLGCSDDTLNAGATEYASPMSSEVALIALIAFEQNTIPTGGNIKDFYVRLSQTPGVNPDGYRFTLMLNGVATLLQCTVTDPATTASDLVNSVAVVGYDRVSIRIEPLNGPANTPTAHWGFTFEPTIDGESIIMNCQSGVNHAVNTYYNGIVGMYVAWGVEIGHYQLAQECVFRKLHVILSAAPGAGTSKIITLRQNGAGTLLSVTVADANTQGNDLANSVNILNSAEVDYEDAPVNNPNTSYMYAGLVCYIAPAAAPSPMGGVASKLVAGRLI